MTARKAKPRSRSFKVWMYPDAKDELRRFRNILCYADERPSHSRVRATLTLERGKGKKGKK